MRPLGAEHGPFSAEDVRSIAAVLAMLEDQVAKLGSASQVAALWRDWSDLLRPTAAGGDDRALDLALELTTPGGSAAVSSG